MWDLSVPGGGEHDFYIDTADTAVHVHNTCGPDDQIPKAPRSSYGKSEVPSWVINEGYTPNVGRDANSDCYENHERTVW
jgi:hypothetical protein